MLTNVGNINICVIFCLRCRELLIDNSFVKLLYYEDLSQLNKQSENQIKSNKYKHIKLNNKHNLVGAILLNLFFLRAYNFILGRIVWK